MTNPHCDSRLASPSRELDAGTVERVLEEVWDSATNAVCQTLQDADMCKCPSGRCYAAEVRLPETEAKVALRSLRGA